MTEQSRVLRWRQPLVGAVLLAWGVWSWNEGHPLPSQAIAATHCHSPVYVDGVLRCEVETTQLSDLCSNRPSDERGDRIRVGDAIDTDLVCAESQPRRGGPGWGRMPPDALRRLDIPVAMNGATLEELTSLPGIGPTIAQRIVEGRPYHVAEDLLDIKGIGPKTLARIASRLRFD